MNKIKTSDRVQIVGSNEIANFEIDKILTFTLKAPGSLNLD